MEKLNRLKVIETIKNNKYFECVFVKKDNTVREMKCVYENDNSNSNYVTVYDIENQGYRQVNLLTLMSLTIKDTFYKIC